MNLHSGNRCGEEQEKDKKDSVESKEKCSGLKESCKEKKERKSIEPLPTLQQSLEMISSKSIDESSSNKRFLSKGNKMSLESFTEMQGNERAKVPGRWSPEEHKRFTEGYLILLSLSSQTIWEKLEEGGRVCGDTYRGTDKEPCTEIL